MSGDFKQLTCSVKKTVIKMTLLEGGGKPSQKLNKQKNLNGGFTRCPRNVLLRRVKSVHVESAAS